MCYAQAWKYPVSGYMYSNYISNSTDSKPTTACVEVCTDDALLHRVGLMQSELILLALCCGGDYDPVSPIFYRSDLDAYNSHSHIDWPIRLWIGDHISTHQILTW